MGGEERVARQHQTGRLTVRERVERLFDDGHLPRDRRDRRQGHLRRARRADRLPAREHDRRAGADRRTPRGAPGRRLHGARRGGRRRDLAEDGLRRADGARSAPAARAPRRRDRGRRQREAPRDDGLHVRAVRSRLGARRREPLGRARGRRGARARRRARGGARGGLAFLGDRARDVTAVRRRPAGRGGGDGRGAGQGAARRLADADRGRRGRQRGGGRGRCARPTAALPVLPAAERMGAPADLELERPAGPPRREPHLDRPARAAQAVQGASDPRRRLRPRLGVRARRAASAVRSSRRWRGSTGGLSACWHPTPRTSGAA